MRVSVVMATHNPNLAMIRETVKSVNAQTFHDIELIIIDDGSDKPLNGTLFTDFNGEVPIKILRINHSGLGAALNYGISHANGEYIARLDDDDLMLPTRIEAQVKFLDEHKEIVCVGTNIYYKVDDVIYPHKLFPKDHEGIIKSLVNLHFSMAHSSLMFRIKSFEEVGGYRIAGAGQDLDFLLQMGTVGKLANINDYLTYYTLSESGLSNNYIEKKDAYLFALSSAKEKECYRSYINVINSSMDHVIRVKKNGNFTRLSKRKILMMIVKCLGRRSD